MNTPIVGTVIATLWLRKTDSPGETRSFPKQRPEFTYPVRSGGDREDLEQVEARAASFDSVSH